MPDNGLAPPNMPWLWQPNSPVGQPNALGPPMFNYAAPPNPAAPTVGQGVAQTAADVAQAWPSVEEQRRLLQPLPGWQGTAVDAAKQWADAVMMGSTAPGDQGIPAFQHMLEQIKSDPEAHWGIRVTEDPVAQGQRLNRSRVWNEDQPTSRFLPGTSSVGVWEPTEQALTLALRKAGVAPHGVPWDYYYGQHVSLLKGSDSSAGTDPGERILKNARVAATYMKQDAGPSELLPVQQPAGTQQQQPSQ